MELRNPEKTYDMARDWYRNSPGCILAMRALKEHYPNMIFVGFRLMCPYCKGGTYLQCIDATAEVYDVERVIQGTVPGYSFAAGDTGDFAFCIEPVSEFPKYSEGNAFDITELCYG